MKKSVIALSFVIGVILLFAAACGSKTASNANVSKAVKSVPVGNLTATLSSETGTLKHGPQDLVLTFTDASGKTVDVGAASLNFHMPQMGAMAAMNEGVTLTTTNTPGVYHGKVNITMTGEWQAQLAYEGPAGTGKTTFSVTAQ